MIDVTKLHTTTLGEDRIRRNLGLQGDDIINLCRCWVPKSTLIRKLEAGDRNIYREFIAFCNYKGKRHTMLHKRRKAEFALLYVP